LTPILKWERRGSSIKNVQEPDRLVNGASVASRPTTASSEQAEANQQQAAAQQSGGLGARWAAPRPGGDAEPSRAAAMAFAGPRDSLSLEGSRERFAHAAAADTGDARRNPMRAASLDGRERDIGQPLSRMDARGSIDYGSEERRMNASAGPFVTGGPAPRTQSARPGTPLSRRDNSPSRGTNAANKAGKRDPSPRLLPRPGSAPDRGGPRRLPSPAGRPDDGRIDGRDSTRDRRLDPAAEIYRDRTDRVDRMPVGPQPGQPLVAVPQNSRPTPGGVRGEGSAQAMSAFRTGGPVKARTDVLSDSLLRARGQRPQTAPSGRPSTPDRTRPSSPLRPADRRPPSPQRASLPEPSSAVGSFRFGGGSMSATVGLDKSSRRMLSSHMRRAPSPTPAFNRQPSPNRPRWRA